MEFGWNFLWFIVAVSLLVTVHEYGHFWVARRLGFKVLRFSIGFGKPLFKKIGRGPDHTEFVIAAVPLGGYVKLVDERDGPVNPGDLSRAYQSKRPWQRILMLLAGPGANFVFAIAVLWAVFWGFGIPHVKAEVGQIVNGKFAAQAGLRPGDEVLAINGTLVLDQADATLWLLEAISDEGKAVLDVRGRNGAQRTVTLFVPEPAERHGLTEPNKLYDGLGFHFWSPSLLPIIGAVHPGGPAAAAGLLPNDRIESVDGTAMRSFDELADYINGRPAQNILLTVRRGNETFSRRVQTTSEQRDGRVIGRLHIEPSASARAPVPPGMMTRTEVGPFGAFNASISKAWQMTAAQTVFFVRMLTGKISPKNLSSPIGIAGYAGDSARAGAEIFLMFLVLISLSLGFLNLLPIPILDGGQIVFAVAEWLKGSPLSERVQAIGWHAGLLMLALLMGVAVFNDLAHRFVPS